MDGEKLYKIIFSDGKLSFMVATNLSHEECVELVKRQLEPSAYKIQKCI